jgi:hypothetical protein
MHPSTPRVSTGSFTAQSEQRLAAHASASTSTSTSSTSTSTRTIRFSAPAAHRERVAPADELEQKWVPFPFVTRRPLSASECR